MRRMILCVVSSCVVWIVTLQLLPVAHAQAGVETSLVAPYARKGSIQVISLGKTVAMSWLAEKGPSVELVLSVSRDGGQRYYPPVVVGAVQPATFPKPAIAIWTDENPGQGDAVSMSLAWPAFQQGVPGVMVARSGDAGRTFTRTFLRSGTVPSGGMIAGLAFGPTRRLHVIWLAGARLLYAHDRAGTLDAPRVIDDAASRCGIVAVVAGPGKDLAVFWYRNFATSDEEFAFIRSKSEGNTFDPVVRVSRERWGFTGCPGPSPSLTVDGSGALRFVFQAMLPGNPARSSFFADRTSDRQTFRPRAFVDAPGFDDARSPVLATDGQGGLSLVWDGNRNGRRYVVIRHSLGAPGITTGIEADWMRPSPPIVLDQSGEGATPAVARAPEGMLAAWITGHAAATRVATRRFTIDQLCGVAP